MFELQYSTSFSAAHMLNNYPGDCSRLHGHNWKVTVVVKTAEINELGIGIDLKDLKKITNNYLEKFDHRFLNDIPEFKNMNPTSENIARFFYMEMAKLFQPPVYLKKIMISESDKYAVSYQG